jgi:hypothetical protein
LACSHQEASVTRDEVGELYLKLQGPMVSWLCGGGWQRDQAEDMVNDVFCYVLETQNKRTRLPIQPRYQRRHEKQVTRLLWARLKGRAQEKRKAEWKQRAYEYELIRRLNPSIFEGFSSRNDVEDN